MSRAEAVDDGRRPGRRELMYVVLAGLAGAALAGWAATRVWLVEWTPRPAPLPSVRVEHTGSGLWPWLPASAVVGLAGMGAVLATRGIGRRLVGVLLLLVGAGLLVGGAAGLVTSSGMEPDVRWPALTVLGGLLVTGAALTVVLRGHRWPTMGARYERTGGGARLSDPARPDPTGGRVTGARVTAAWEALDRGEDPTG